MKTLLAFLIMTTAANAADSKLEVAAFMMMSKTFCNERIDERALESNVVVGSADIGISTEQGRWFAGGMAQAYFQVLNGKGAMKAFCGVTP